MTISIAREENGEFCITVSLVIRTASILTCLKGLLLKEPAFR